MAENENTSTLYQETHGGAKAVKDLTYNRPFTGLAREKEKEIEAQFVTDGPESILKTQAVRLATAADLYWSALMGAAENNNAHQFESYAKTFGWLATATARITAQIITAKPNDPRAGAAMVLSKLKEVGHDSE